MNTKNTENDEGHRTNKISLAGEENTATNQTEVQEKLQELVTDEQLENAGLVKITAYVRTEQSKAAERKAKQRQKEESEGVKQLNLKANAENHEILKKVAASLQSASTEQKKLLEDILAQIKNSNTPAPNAKPSVTSHKIVTGFKGKIVLFLNWIIEKLVKP